MGLNNLCVEESLENLEAWLAKSFVGSQYRVENGIIHFNPIFFCDAEKGVIYFESKKDKKLAQGLLFVRFKGKISKYSKPGMEIYDHEINGNLSPEAALNFAEALREYNFGGKPLNTISSLL